VKAEEVVVTETLATLYGIASQNPNANLR
jgi:hypothetical protein